MFNIEFIIFYLNLLLNIFTFPNIAVYKYLMKINLFKLKYWYLAVFCVKKRTFSFYAKIIKLIFFYITFIKCVNCKIIFKCCIIFIFNFQTLSIHFSPLI